MAASTIFVFDASPLIASCQFSVGRRAVADIALSGARVQILPDSLAMLRRLNP